MKNNTSNIIHNTSRQPRLSIIVPIYNVAPYLRKCVDSLLLQDISDYEIILVDDGSTDGSGAIADEILNAHSQLPIANCQIKVVHQLNAGLSAARNSGIEVARGEYIMFVDSDDYLEPNVLGALMAQIERDNLDVLRFNYQNVNEKGEVFQPFKSIKPYFDYSAGVMDGETFLNERLGYACYAWAFILRRDLIYSAQSSDTQHDTSDVAQRVLFTPVIYFEDTDWTPRMLLKAQRVASTDRIVYNYLWRQGSITLPDNPAKKKKVLEDKISLLDGFQRHQQLTQNKKWFEWQIAGTTMSVLGILSIYPFTERELYIKQLKSKCIFPLSTYRANRNTKLKIWLANISPSLYCKLINFIHK